MTQVDAGYLEDVITGWCQLATDRVWHEGLTWYADANTIARGLADDYNLPVWVTAAVIAILSPGCHWTQNIEDASTICQAWRAGLTPEDCALGTYNTQKYKAWHLLDTYQTLDTLDARLAAIGKDTARKTRAFWQNILDSQVPVVTIDRWVSRAVTLAQDAIHPTGVLYAQVQDAFCRVAAKLELAPCQVQAIVWLVIRDRGLDGQAQDYLF